MPCVARSSSAIVLSIDSLWPSDAIWRYRSGSTLAQVIACCLTAPSHYLNQCWLIINKVQWHSSEGNFAKDIPATKIIKISLKITYLKFHSNHPGVNELRKVDSHEEKFKNSVLFYCGGMVHNASTYVCMQDGLNIESQIVSSPCIICLVEPSLLYFHL